ncbi:MAG: hypothetical protein VW864_05545 [Flavobacteriaceae bacterium]
MIHVLAPTFDECSHVKNFINSWLSCNLAEEVNIIIINGNYGDETTDLINNLNIANIFEIEASKNDYWSGLVNKGLIFFNQHKRDKDSLIITNIDVMPPKDLKEILSIEFENNYCISIPAIDQDSQLLDGGIKQISWLLDLKKKYYYKNSSTINIENIDYCPTRFLIVRNINNESMPLTLEEKLPHYGSDYEYTNRLRIGGFWIFCVTSSFAINDSHNSGIKKNNIFNQDLKEILFGIKSTFNIKYRTSFVLNFYPKIYIPFVLLSVYLRILFYLFKFKLLKKFF